MFDAIAVLPDTNRDLPLDIGELAEKMLYYRQVHLFANPTELQTLFTYFSVDLLIEYIKDGFIKLYDRKRHFGVGMIDGKYMSEFFFNKNYDLKQIITDAYFRFSGDIEKSRSAANKLYRHIGIYETPNDYARLVEEDLKDPNLMKAIILQNIKHYAPHDKISTDDLEFNVESSKGNLVSIQSNLDTIKFPSLNPDTLILNIGSAYDEIKICSRYNSEIFTPELNSKIISAKVNSVITKATKSTKEIDVFHHFVFADGPSIKEVINSGERNMTEFLALLREATKFKNWLTDLGENANIIREYTTRIKEKTWLQSAPAKAVRFFLVQGISAIFKAADPETGVAAGIGLSAANTFLIDSLFKGWKPSQYIQEEVMPFVKKDV